MKKNLKTASLILVAAAIFSSCKKSEQIKSDSEIITKGNNLSIADGKWDVLSHGYDATKNFLNPNGLSDGLSDAPIIDMTRFAADYSQRIDVGTGSIGTDSAYIGSSVLDYLKDINKRKTYGLEASFNKKEVKDSNKLFFSGTANVSWGQQDHNTKTYYSKYVFATYESLRIVKRIRFTGDVSKELLMQYLTPEFANNVATKDATYLVSRYGTHVLLDITLGGRLKFDYGASIDNQSDYAKKVRNTKAGLTGLLGKIGINLSSDVTKEEITKSLTENTLRSFTVTYVGGTNSGVTLSGDANGNFGQAINLPSFQTSITDRNCLLMDIGKAVRLSEFISDPIKKSQVEAAINKHIADSQIKELGEVPVFQYYLDQGQDYILSLNNNAIDPIYPGWEFQGSTFYGFKSAVNGAVPIYEFRNHQMTRTIYSSNKNTVSPVWPGWSAPAIAFYAYSNGSVPGTVPVYEFYNQQNECNLYSTDINAVNGYPGWSRLGIVFYAFPKIK